MNRKNFLSSLLFVVILSQLLMAQAPQKISYQAVVRNSSNNLMPNTTVGVLVSIMRNGTEGIVVYQERHTAITNANGLMTLQVGGGEVLQGDFSTIQWGDGTYFIKTETDLEGGINYTIATMQQLLSVPYALYAENAGNANNAVEQVNADWNATSGPAEILNKPTIPIVPDSLSAYVNDLGYVTNDDLVVILDTAHFTETQSLSDVVALGNSAGQHQLKNLLDPTDPQDAVTKVYVDSMTRKVDSLINMVQSLNRQLDSIIADYSHSNIAFSGDMPVVITKSVTYFVPTNATVISSVLSEGGSHVIQEGVCWDTLPSPTLNDRYVIATNGMNENSTILGDYVCSITGLVKNKTYYVRSFATNAYGTIYGNERVLFFPNDTMPCPNASTVTDYDGNVYGTVRLGQQCWMTENMRAKHFSNGDTIIVSDSNVQGNEIARCFFPSDADSLLPVYGYLYNYRAATGNNQNSSSNPSSIQGVCPNGWHVPSLSEWQQLIDYVKTNNAYWCNNNSSYINKALASISGWDNHTYTCDCCVGDNPSSNATGLGFTDASGFFYRRQHNGCSGSFQTLCTYACYWSTTLVANFQGGFMLSKGTGYGDVHVGKFSNLGSGIVLPVRCLKD